MPQGGWQVGVGTGASTGGVPLGLLVTCKPCHTQGRKILLIPPGEEGNRLVAMGIELGLGRS
eukprot:9733094-Prorocentrum_lima.AAC.1